MTTQMHKSRRIVAQRTENKAERDAPEVLRARAIQRDQQIRAAVEKMKAANATRVATEE